MFIYKPGVGILVLEFQDQATHESARLARADGAGAMRGCVCPTRN